MKRLAIPGALVLGTMLLLASGMACAAGLKIGIIDTQKIMRESRAAKSARAILVKDVEAKRGVLKAKEDEVRALQEELKKQGQDMSLSARKEKGEDFEREIRELKRLKSDLEEELKKKDREMARKLLLEIRDVVNEFLKKEKFTVILEKRSVVAADEAVDITDKIIRLYDAVK
jgi:outer membrane protein